MKHYFPLTHPNFSNKYCFLNLNSFIAIISAVVKGRRGAAREWMHARHFAAARPDRGRRSAADRRRAAAALSL